MFGGTSERPSCPSPRPQSACQRPGSQSRTGVDQIGRLPPLVGLVRCPAFDLPCVCPLPATFPPPSATGNPVPVVPFRPRRLARPRRLTPHTRQRPPLRVLGPKSSSRRLGTGRRPPPKRLSGPPNQQAGSWVSDLGSPVAGLLHPAAEQGSLRFSRPAPGSEESGCSRAGSIPGTSPESVPTGPSCHRIEPRRIFRRGCVQSRAPTRGLSRSAVRTLRRSPPASSRVLSPGPLPSCRCAPILPTRARRAFSMWALDFRALLRCRVRSAPHRCR